MFEAKLMVGLRGLYHIDEAFRPRTLVCINLWGQKEQVKVF